MMRSLGSLLAFRSDQLQKHLRSFAVHSRCQTIDQQQRRMGQCLKKFTDQRPETLTQER